MSAINIRFLKVSLLITFFVLMMYKTEVHRMNTPQVFITQRNIFRPSSFGTENNSVINFLVDTKVCKIVDIDPFDDSINHLLNYTHKVRVCNESNDFTYIENNILYVNQSRKPNGVTYCRAKPIFTYQQKSIKFGEPSEKFMSSLPIKDEFLQIDCYNESDSIVVQNLHMNFVKKKAHRPDKKSSGPNMNVILIMLDSTSRINSLRYMQETRQYLSETLGAVEMTGYTKVADNTKVNMVPLLTGDYVERQPCMVDQQGVDNCSFIWKNFSRKGYLTHLGESLPHYALFHYFTPGFKHDPTDYYDFPFHEADKERMTIKETKWFTGCFQGSSWSNVMYNRIFSLAKNLGQKPYFSFTLEKRHTHWKLEKLADIDKTTKDAFLKLYENNLLNNTFLAIFGDHGMRFGKIRKSVVGQLEERLPLMFIHVPVWFRKQYPVYFKNLKINSKRLTSHFDIHSTLLHILDLDKNTPQNNNPYGISLFNKIPTSRTCKEAGIPVHWCTCNYHLATEAKTAVSKKMANVVVKHLNLLLKNERDKCKKLRLKNIEQCSKLSSETDSGNSYRIVIRTTPGKALFESTVKYIGSKKKYSVMGDISRLTMYKNQSECMEDYTLRKFCVCKQQLIQLNTFGTKPSV